MLSTASFEERVNFLPKQNVHSKSTLAVVTMFNVFAIFVTLFNIPELFNQTDDDL